MIDLFDPNKATPQTLRLLKHDSLTHALASKLKSQQKLYFSKVRSMIKNTPDRNYSGKDAERYDVIIVGAGISGICSAHALRKAFPEKRFLILESMERFGGTWQIHKYPGTRSDSDLFTFGYGFKPWIGNPIATRQQILDYLGSVIADADLAPHIRYKHRVLTL